MEVKVCTFNIKFDSHDDHPHLWKRRLPLISKIIDEFSPDIFGSQEGRRQQIRNLENNLNNLTGIHAHREWIEKRMYPTLFIANDWTILEAGDIWLSETPHIAGSSSFKSTFPRLCTWAKLFHQKNKLEILTYNLHLDHVLEETRKEQIKVLCSEIKKIHNPNMPFLLIGDFNEGPEGPVRSILLENFPSLYDPWSHLCLTEEGSYHKFNGENSQTKRIDWILCSSHFSCLDIKMFKNSFNNIWPSDHFAIMAKLNIKT
jgi:endonuclease/exonuclease/phosphatase family metal-dependent hydrolase